MFSIRNQSIVLAGIIGAASFGGLGCASSSCPCARPNAPVVSKTMVPIAEQPVADEATNVRGWHKSIAWYQSGATQAWPTRWYYAPNPDYTTPINFAVDPLGFLAQTASLPVTLALEPPFKQPVIYAGDVLPPSYNANPPLPPEQAESRTAPDPDPLGQPKPAIAPPLPPVKEPLPPTYVPPVPPKALKATRSTSASPTTRPVH